MELHNALKTIIEQQGNEILKDYRLVNILSDFNAYGDVPASKFLIKNMINEGVMAKLMSEHMSPVDVETKLASHRLILSDTYGFKEDLVDYVLSCLAYAIGWTTAIPSLGMLKTGFSGNSIKEGNGMPLQPTDDGKPHLLFKQYPITGDINIFIKQLESIGFIVEEPFSTYYNYGVMRGKFAGVNNCVLDVVATPISHTACRVIVEFPPKHTWDDLKAQYEEFKTRLSKKYGSPNGYEYFSDPYYEGDGNEMVALGDEKCSYCSYFRAEFNDGIIALYLSPDCQTCIAYEDTVNTDIAGKENEQLAENDL